MKIASILENQKIEKRIAITPEIAKKYISIGIEVSLSENYGSHLGDFRSFRIMRPQYQLIYIFLQSLE